jgi:UDP-N-acetylglucosamine 2-epimerase (non-hydrolysing)
VTGNTVIDFLKNNIKKNYKHPLIDWTAKDKFALLTLHRRENWGENMEKMMLNISKFSIKNEYKIIYVTNQNNKIKKLASRIFKNNKFVKFSNPLEPVDFHNILNHSEFVITDSGGIQEEASFLKKPIVILRNETERDEIVKSKCGVLSSCENLQEVLESVINNTIKFNKTSKLFGSGNSGLKIVSLIEKHLNDY